MERWRLQQRQSLPLDAKVCLSEFRIRKWHEHWQGDTYVSFSGGKDSTVLLDLVRGMYPDTPAVFVDTGLEYPEIRDFVKTVDNVTWAKPEMGFKQVIEKYGYPVISKKVSMGLSRYRNTKSDLQRQLRLHGGICPTSGKKQYRTIPIKWHFMTQAPFKCSEACCDVLKKRPAKKYGKQSGRKAYIGTMTEESTLRTEQYLKTGCNGFALSNPISTPMAFWVEQDVWDYIKLKKLEYSKIYDMGEDRTGCMFCMFGVHMEKGENRFQRMKKTHPSQYRYCMESLGCGEVLDYMGIAI